MPEKWQHICPRLRAMLVIGVKINQPEYVIFENGKFQEISLYGLADFLNSEMNEKI